MSDTKEIEFIELYNFIKEVWPFLEAEIGSKDAWHQRPICEDMVANEWKEVGKKELGKVE